MRKFVLTLAALSAATAASAQVSDRKLDCGANYAIMMLVMDGLSKDEKDPTKQSSMKNAALSYAGRIMSVLGITDANAIPPQLMELTKTKMTAMTANTDTGVKQLVTDIQGCDSEFGLQPIALN